VVFFDMWYCQVSALQSRYRPPVFFHIRSQAHLPLIANDARESKIPKGMLATQRLSAEKTFFDNLVWQDVCFGR